MRRRTCVVLGTGLRAAERLRRPRHTGRAHVRKKPRNHGAPALARALLYQPAAATADPSVLPPRVAAGRPSRTSGRARFWGQPRACGVAMRRSTAAQSTFAKNASMYFAFSAGL